MPRRSLLLPLTFLLLTSLACQTIYKAFELPNPEGLATDAFPTATPKAGQVTLTPPPTRASVTPKTPGATATLQPTLPAEYADLAQFQAAQRDGFTSDIAQFPHATRYALEVTVTFGDASAFLDGRERIHYTNQQTFPLATLYLMLWPNDRDQYLSEMTLQNVRVDGAPLDFSLENDGIAARVDLTQPLAPGAALDVSAEFSVSAHPGIDDTTPARFGLTNGVLLAPTFYPLIPRIIDGQWQTIPAPSGGDTTNSDTALYWWRVTAPKDLTIVASGTVIDSSLAGDTQTQTLVTGPMRDLALVVGPLELYQREVDGLTLNAYVLQDHAAYAPKMLDFTEAQVQNLQAEVGPYPFSELDVVDAPGAFGGIEYPGEIFIGVVGDSDFFEYATVHEVGHQWFYSLIGDDQLLQPWLDEAAATYTEYLYQEKVHGSGEAEGFLGYLWDDVKASDNPDLPIGLGVGDYPSERDYGTIVYSKGALFFDALRRELGDKVFFEFLHNYYAAYRYGFATSQDFQATAEQTCACDLGALFDLWVYKGGQVKP
jgi:hypothetical protein